MKSELPQRDERKVTIYVWIACSVSMFAIVIMWLFTLPWQFELIEQKSKGEPQRWEAAPINLEDVNLQP